MAQAPRNPCLIPGGAVEHGSYHKEGVLPRARAMGSAAAVQSALGSAASGGVGCINAQASLNGAAAISQGQPVQKNSSVNP